VAILLPQFAVCAASLYNQYARVFEPPPVKRFLDYTIQHQHRLILIADTFGFRLAAREPTPVYDALKELLTEEVGVHGDKREQVGMAIVSLAMGTARMIIATGNDTAAAKGFSRTCQAALQQLLAASSRTDIERCAKAAPDT
jgi:hypothetical protein